MSCARVVKVARDTLTAQVVPVERERKKGVKREYERERKKEKTQEREEKKERTKEIAEKKPDGRVRGS